MKPIRAVIDVLGSFGLSVAVLSGMLLLTFLGTVEQQNTGLYEVQKNYFESWIAMHPTRWGEMPLPGGVLLMSLLAVNLAIGGLVRIRKSKRTAGIIICHVGIALLMAAGLVKLTNSDDGFLALVEGESSDDFVSFFHWEVAIYDAEADPDAPVQEILIDDTDLRALSGGRSRVFSHPDLGFQLELSNYVPNGRPLPVGPQWRSEYPIVDGYATYTFPKANQAEENVPVVYARALVGGQVTSAGILYGGEASPLILGNGDELMALSLRKQRFQMPFTVHLDDFHMEEHPRTRIASVYRSDITKLQDGVEDKVRIEMNRPLRDSGLVLFQSSYGTRMTDLGPRPYSQFSVVRNPSDHWPLYACIVIGVGLLFAFVQRLTAFLKKQNAARRAAA
ncbi:cytochrome c biogenesis protein ResB [Engelhardtia mirabilis]|uniref:ResB-like family protein n=1 Tax=Engelhardtia mirabilis TaxID=2528011 RepID=A0A518BJM9_9BACT|nr:ResB-like family protein [Planctomycetes bacterium Pla133]QDV01511.1 ResB-like family protein [Planctomycetes bacterium Pla86]